MNQSFSLQVGNRMITIICLWLIIHFLVAHKATAQLSITTDTSSLLALRSTITTTSNNTLSHFLMQNWTLGSSVCDWYGVACSSRHRRVVSLNISNMGLQGTIPSEIGNLSFLNVIDLRGNAFSGQLPPDMARLHRLEFINLMINDFSGEIPPWIGNFSRLQYLSLANNSFTGIIPSSLFSMTKLVTFNARFNQLSGPVPDALFNVSSLETIDLTFNQLTGNLSGDTICRNIPGLLGLFLSGNLFSGEILSGLHRCSLLQRLSLSTNMFTGRIPPEIGNLIWLRTAFLGSNNWTGEIPPEMGNMSSLQVLQMGSASLTGTIPDEIGNLSQLRNLVLEFNSLQGLIPPSIFNISTLAIFSAVANNLSGSLPSCVYYNLPNIEHILLGSNALTGTIPGCISNYSNLVILELAANYFTGSIPTSLGSLRLLEVLNLAGNGLSADSFTDLSFISSLTNCINLQTLAISHNPLNSNLPTSIGNFSALENLFVRNCGVTGRIPDEIGNLSMAILLALDNNNFTGTIPSTVNGLHSLNVFYLGDNQLQGSIPEEICELRNLILLYLYRNRLTGVVPTCLENVTTLQYLHLASNMFSSSIPDNIFNLNQLRELNLSDNYFTGIIPQNIGNLRVALIIDLGMNQLSGNIPTTLSSLQSLSNFSLYHNQLDGTIPDSVGSLLALEYLDLSHNNLVGPVPESLEALVYMVHFNVSFNGLYGQIPNGGPFRNFSYESFMPNEALCGAPWLQLAPCAQASRGRKIPFLVIIMVPIIATLVGLLAAFVLIRYYKRKNNTSVKDEIPTLAAGYERFSYYEIQLATNGFSQSNLLATGGFGSVYQGNLSNGMVVAVKVFNLQSESSYASFDTECQVLRNLRHRNLTKIISSCSNLDFRALVLEYMTNGSLDSWLYSHNNFLGIQKRLDIMIDVAAAIEYLHHGYTSPVIHCDLKPSNVLLDENMTGYVTDFGISKLFGLGEFIAQTKTVATIGYIAPEYGSKGLVSTKSDMYSYGILLMEVFSRKRPTDEMFSGDSSLKSWVAELYSEAVIQIVDENLIPPETDNLKDKLQCLKSIMELAQKCCEELPEERINMIDTLVCLKKLRTKFQDLL